MKIIPNQAPDRVVDFLSNSAAEATAISIVAAQASVFGLEAAFHALPARFAVRLLLPGVSDIRDTLPGATGDRRRRSQLRYRAIASAVAEQLRAHGEIRNSRQAVGQSLMLLEGQNSPILAISGDCSLTSEGLGLVPQTTLGFVNLSEEAAELAYFQRWFQTHWDAAPISSEIPELVQALADFAGRHPTGRIYAQTLATLFDDFVVNGPGAVRTATGIRETAIWQKLYRFQKGRRHRRH